MKKVSKPFRRTDKKGYWVRWFENGRKHLKAFNTTYEARLWSRRKYIELNMDVYGAVNMQWCYAVREYLQQYEIKGYADCSRDIAKKVLTDFEELVRPRTIEDISQAAVDSYIKHRIKTAKSRYTINKDIGRLKAFIHWLCRRNYHSGRIDITLMKVPQIIRKALTNDEIRSLLRACPNNGWKIRILLSLCTGLRKGDIDTLKICQIDLKRATIDYTAKKTLKGVLGRPIPSSLIPALKQYVNSLSNKDNDTLLIPDRNKRKEWDKIKRTTGLPQATRQQLRVTFSTLIQKIGSISEAKNLLQHSTVSVTETFYTDYEWILRWKIEQLPVNIWLKGL